MIDEDAEKRAVDGGFEIGIGEKDIGRLAAEFERDALHRVGGLLDDDLADGRAAGERNLVHIGMLNERSTASFTESGHDVDDARRQSAVGKVLREFQSRERRLLCGLEHARAPCSNGRRKFPCRHQQRIVPRNDLSRNADGLFE